MMRGPSIVRVSSPGEAPQQLGSKTVPEGREKRKKGKRLARELNNQVENYPNQLDKEIDNSRLADEHEGGGGTEEHRFAAGKVLSKRLLESFPLPRA